MPFEFVKPRRDDPGTVGRGGDQTQDAAAPRGGGLEDEKRWIKLQTRDGGPAEAASQPRSGENCARRPDPAT